MRARIGRGVLGRGLGAKAVPRRTWALLLLALSAALQARVSLAAAQSHAAADGLLATGGTDVDAADAALKARVEQLMGPRYHRRQRFAKPDARCKATLDGCLCASGCPTSWRGCRPSVLCNRANASAVRVPDAAALSRKAILLYATFKREHVRRKFNTSGMRFTPDRAFRRERRRIEWFLHSARRVRTRLPIYVVVGGHRNASIEARFTALGARILPGPYIEPPAWTSTYHKFSFNRISALSFTMFDKVIVMDNDMVRILLCL